MDDGGTRILPFDESLDPTLQRICEQCFEVYERHGSGLTKFLKRRFCSMACRAAWCRGLGKDQRAETFRPDRGVGNGRVDEEVRPCKARPGTDAKIKVLEERAERKVDLFHPDDNQE